MKDLTHYFQLPSKEEEGGSHKENSFLVLDLESGDSKSVKKLKKNRKPFLAPSENRYNKSKSSKNHDSPSSSSVTGPRKKNTSKLKKQNIEDNVATEDVDCEKDIHISDIEIGLQEIKIPTKKKRNHPKQKFCKLSPKLKKKRKKLSLVANDIYVDSETSQSGLGKIKTTAGSSSHSPPADVHLRKISPNKNVFEIPSDESKDCETITESYSLQSSLVKCRSGEFISSELTSQTKYDSSDLESSQKQSTPVQPNNPKTQPRTNAFEKLMSVQVHCAQSESSDDSCTDLENIPKVETCERDNEEQHNVMEKTHRTRRQHNLENKLGKKSTKRKRLNKDVPNELVERMAKKIKRLVSLNYDSDVDVNEVVDTDNDIESKEKKTLDINTPLENLTADHFVPSHRGKAKYKCKQKKKFTPEKAVPTKENSENSQKEIKKKSKHKPPVSEPVLEDPVTVQLQKALKRVEKAEKSIQKYMEMRNSCTTTNSQNKTVSQELTENIKSRRIGLRDPRASTEVLNETSNNNCPVITDGIKSPCKENILENSRPTIEFQKDKSSKGNSHKKESKRIKGSPDKKALLKVTRILDEEMEPHIYYSSLKDSANVEMVDKVKRNKRSHKRKSKTDLEVNDSSQSTEARYDTKLSDSCDEIKCKNGLFNYFNKVSKEEVLSKPQKIQVKALVHTPPTTPTKKLKKKNTPETVCPTQKKFKRRSSNRLALSDEISLLCSEVIQLEQNSNDFDFSVDYKVRTPTKLNDVQLTVDREIKKTTENKTLSEVEVGCKVFQSTSNLKLKTPSKNCENIDKSNEGRRKIPLSNTWKLRVHLGNQEKNALDSGSESDEPDPSDDSDSIFTINTKQKNTKKPRPSKLKEDDSERSKPYKMLILSDDSDVMLSPSSRRKNNKSSVKKMVIRNGKMRFSSKNKETDAVRTDSSAETLSSDDSSGMETQTSRKKTKESYLQKTVVTGRKTRVSLRIIESNAKTPPIDHEKEEIISHSKASRLAPVFLRGNSRFKPKVDPLIVEARRNFLMSGVPDAVKKMVDIQRIFDEQEHTIFPEVSHVQQKDSDSYIWNLPDESTSVVTHSQDLNIEQTFRGENQTLVPGVFTESTTSSTSYERLASPPPITAFRRILRELKLEFPNFPIYRAFRALRDKFLEHEEGCVPGEGNKKGRGRSKGLQPEEKVAINSQVLWTEKYRPTCVDDVFINLGSVRQLKSWLETWKNHCEEAGKRDHQACDSSSEDEFINDGDGGSHSNGPDNTAILLGPYGSGKTAAVYAVASELGCKVLEMNASSKRTGKRVLSELLEATQSHRVGKGADTTGRNVAGFFRNGSTPKVKQKKMEREKKKAKEEKCSKMSIILVEAADIFFDEQDEGFVSALSSLVAASKRPVIFTTSEANCPHLLKFMCQHLLLHFSPASPTVMSVWLQLLCLLEGIRLSNSAIKALLHWNNGDIRKTILDLQFWVRSNGSTPPRAFKKPTTTNIKTAQPLTDEDDNSNLVWGSEKDKEEKDSAAIPVYYNCADFLRFNNEIPYPLNLSSLWWNLGSLLNLPDVHKCRFNKLAFLSKSVSTKPNNFFSECCTTEDNEEQTIEVDAAEDQPSESAESVSVVDTTSSVSTTNSSTSQRFHSYNLEQMDSLALLTDTLSEVDVVSSCHRFDTYKTNLELCPVSWEQPMKDSLSLRADGRLCCMAEQRVSSMWSHYMSKESLSLCSQQLSQSREESLEAGRCVFNPCVPSHQELSWRSLQHEADRVALAAVSGWCKLDHAAVALDYNPVLRAIGRLEKSRMAGNTKRRNRFFHYLKGLGVDTTDSTLHTLCSTFQEGSS